jgi:hypothetical protein
MKREVYLVPILPAAAALASEGFVGEGRFKTAWRRIAWVLAAILVFGALVHWGLAFRSLAAFAGLGAAIFQGVALVALTAALSAAALAPRLPRALFAAALACGVLCLALRILDERLARFDPLPDWGERVRRECGGDCDGFLYGLKATSLDFYSRMDWIWLEDPARQLPVRMRHRKGFLVLLTSLEPELAKLPVRWEVVDRRADFGSYRAGLLARPVNETLESLSLVRIRAAP